MYRRDTNEFYLHVAVRVKVPEPRGRNPVGVYVGINNVLLASNGFKTEGKPMLRRRRRFRALRRSPQRKGTASAKRRLKGLFGGEGRRVDGVLHGVSWSFVSSLRRGNVVVIEKLTGIRERWKQRKGGQTFTFGYSTSFNL